MSRVHRAGHVSATAAHMHHPRLSGWGRIVRENGLEFAVCLILLCSGLTIRIVGTLMQ